MFTRIRPTVVACLPSLLLASCRGQPTSEPVSVITFTPHEVALLVGLNEDSGVTFGQITSDRDGVKVASIRWQDKTGRQLDVRDVELAIASTDRLVYAISSLKITELDLLDLKSGQRAQASNLTVVKPGERFLAALADAIATAETGGVLKTAGLTFSRLAVDRL